MDVGYLVADVERDEDLDVAGNDPVAFDVADQAGELTGLRVEGVFHAQEAQEGVHVFARLPGVEAVVQLLDDACSRGGGGTTGRQHHRAGRDEENDRQADAGSSTFHRGSVSKLMTVANGVDRRGLERY